MGEGQRADSKSGDGGVTMTESLSYSRHGHGFLSGSSSPTSRSYFFFTFDQAVIAADEALVQFQAAYLVYLFFASFCSFL
jgi:hypothetical protein